MKAMNRHETCPIMKSTEYQRYYRANIVTEDRAIGIPVSLGDPSKVKEFMWDVGGSSATHLGARDI